MKRTTKRLTHVDEGGRVRMVDVSGKAATAREAVAHAFVGMRGDTIRTIRRVRNPKGDPLEVARIAGIAAAKRTAELIPLCHPLQLSHIDVVAKLCKNGIDIEARAATVGPTGVEMEALVAAGVAALTVYDMCKAVDRGMEISQIYLVEKSGGRSGMYKRTARK